MIPGRLSALSRHAEGEARDLLRRGHCQRPSMRSGDLGGDVEAEAEPLLARAGRGARRRARTGTSMSRRRDGRAGVGDGQLETVVAARARTRPGRSVAVGQGVGQQVGERAGRCARGRRPRAAVRSISASIVAIRPGRPQLGDDLLQDRLQMRRRTIRLRRARRPAGRGRSPGRCRSARPSARRSLHQRDHRRGLLRRATSLSSSRRAGVDRGQRIAQVVAEDGDELLAQLRGLPFVQERPSR